MVTTTFAAAALSALFSAGAVAVPSFERDYGSAMATAVAQQKPLAVFVGRGEAGYAGVVGGEIPAAAGQLLAKSFVCVYVDTATTAGKELADQFALSKGLVISCKGGNVQALKYTGTVAPTDLTGYLTKYSEAKTVTTTEKAGEGVVVPTAAVYSVGGCANGRCGTVLPAGYSYGSPVAAPSYYQGFSSCPNGKCPNAR